MGCGSLSDGIEYAYTKLAGITSCVPALITKGDESQMPATSAALKMTSRKALRSTCDQIHWAL